LFYITLLPNFPNERISFVKIVFPIGCPFSLLHHLNHLHHPPTNHILLLREHNTLPLKPPLEYGNGEEEAPLTPSLDKKV
jgi:hypothetical protein